MGPEKCQTPAELGTSSGSFVRFGGLLRNSAIERKLAGGTWRWDFMMGFDGIQGGAPPVISWFIIPITIDITPINPSYNTYKPT